MNSRVYLVQRPTARNPVTGIYEDKFDLRPALRYGEIIELLRPGNIRPDHDRIMETLLHQMRDFTSQDYLLALGDPVAMCAAACIALDVCGGRLQMLKWDRHNKSYLPYTINLLYGTDGAGVYADE